MNTDIHLFLFRRPADQPLLPHSDLLLAKAGQKFSGESSGWQVERPPGGKPRFSHRPGVEFSLSHSGDYWLCAMSRQPLGLDLQEHRLQDYENISRRFFSPEEDAYLRSRDYEDFFTLWTAKESYVKCIGRGIDQEFSCFSVADEQGLRSRVKSLELRQLPFLPGYSLCLCAGEIGVLLLRML